MHWRRKWQPTPVFFLENPRDGGAWWATISGVAQSQTLLKRLSRDTPRPWSQSSPGQPLPRSSCTGVSQLSAPSSTLWLWLSLWQLLLWQDVGSWTQQLWCVGSVVPRHMGSQFPDHRSNQRPPHCEAILRHWTTREGPEFLSLNLPWYLSG